MSSFLKKVRVLAKREFKNEYEMDAYIDSIESSEQMFRAEIWRDGDRIMCEFIKRNPLRDEYCQLPADLKLDVTQAFEGKDMSWVTSDEETVDFDASFNLSERKFNSIYLVPKGKKKLDAIKLLDLKAPSGKTMREVFDDAIEDFDPRDDEDYGSPDGFANDNDYYSWRFGGKKW